MYQEQLNFDLLSQLASELYDLLTKITDWHEKLYKVAIFCS